MLKDPNSLYLIRAYSNHGLVIDTNLLILDFVGDYNTSKITSYKRTALYTVKDYYLLQALIKSFRKVIVNQPILTEAFNLIDSLNNIENFKLNQHLIQRLQRFAEVNYTNRDILGMQSFIKYGFADASLDYLSSNNLILTDDLRLFWVSIKTRKTSNQLQPYSRL